MGFLEQFKHEINITCTCYFAFTDCVVIILLHCLHCTVIQLFGYLYSRKCAK